MAGGIGAARLLVSGGVAAVLNLSGRDCCGGSRWRGSWTIGSLLVAGEVVVGSQIGWVFDVRCVDVEGGW